MKHLGNQGVTLVSNTNQWFQGKVSDARPSVNGMASTVANTKAVKGVVNIAKNVKVIPVIGNVISIGDNLSEFVRAKNNEKSGWEKTGRAAGGLALDYGPVAAGAAIGAGVGAEFSVGAVPGAAIGATVDSVVSVRIAIGNVATKGELTNWASDKGEAAARKVGETVDTVVDAATKKVDYFVSGVGNAIETGKQAVEMAGKAIAAGKKAADAIGGLFLCR